MFEVLIECTYMYEVPSGKTLKILNYHAAIQFIIYVVLNATFNNITVQIMAVCNLRWILESKD